MNSSSALGWCQWHVLLRDGFLGAPSALPGVQDTVCGATMAWQLCFKAMAPNCPIKQEETVTTHISSM